jgi:ribosomal-protein-alanine N-acetyltransferase
MALFRLGAASENANFIRGEGVYLRPAEMRDYGPWAELRQASRRLRRHQEEIDRDEAYPFLLFRRTDDRLLGGLTLGQVRRGVAQAATLGYWMGAPHAGKGFMAKSVRATAGFAFATLRLHRIEAACLPENAPSIRLLEGVGFRREGFARSYLRINGEWRDHLQFAMIETDRILPRLGPPRG